METELVKAEDCKLARSFDFSDEIGRLIALEGMAYYHNEQCKEYTERANKLKESLPQQIVQLYEGRKIEKILHGDK